MATFDEQISNFVRKNKHLGARFVSVPAENSRTNRVAVVCDRLENFVIPNGLQIEKQNRRYWLRCCYTGEFLEIINRENEREFFRRSE